MAWRIDFTPDAEKALAKLDRQTQKLIRDYLREKIAPLDNPRVCGEGLKANLSGLWRYRVENYRIICSIADEKLVVLVIKIGHRRDVYN